MLSEGLMSAKLSMAERIGNCLGDRTGTEVVLPSFEPSGVFPHEAAVA